VKGVSLADCGLQAHMHSPHSSPAPPIILEISALLNLIKLSFSFPILFLFFLILIPYLFTNKLSNFATPLGKCQDVYCMFV